MNQPNALVAPAEARLQFRNGLVTPTSGWSDGYTQANLIAVPADYADEFIEFCRLNPKACPVIDIIPAGSRKRPGRRVRYPHGHSCLPPVGGRRTRRRSPRRRVCLA